MIKNIDAVVVLYHPDESIIENIKTYQQVRTIYAIDNSEEYNDNLVKKLKQFENLIYINNKGNQGIAHALNVGAKLAIENSADWLLTMDQDSRFIENSLEILIAWIKNNDTSKIGIVSPYHLTKNKANVYEKENKIIDELTVMTSGNLLNLEAFDNVGKFEEKYFIDYVDHEYCLRLRRNGYSIKVHKNCILLHSLGDVSFHYLFGRKIVCTNHNYIRRYYITRNRLNVMVKYFTSYPLFCIKEVKALVFEWIKIILFEKSKMKKQKSIFLGIKDFLFGNYGKYNV